MLPAYNRRVIDPLFSHLTTSERTMDLLLIVGGLLILLALLGFGGIFAALRSAAWLILVVALVIIGLSFIF